MNHSLQTRVLAFVMALVMVVGMMPASALATETDIQNTTPETVTVKFDVNGGIGEYEDQMVIKGSLVTRPKEDPTHNSATFAFWTADLAEVVEWNFEEDAATEDLTLYATYVAAASDEEATDGSDEETAEGSVEGTAEGSGEGTTDGSETGTAEGSDEGTMEGSDEGTAEGSDEGTIEGSDEGTAEGSDEGTTDGSDEGTTEGSDEGTTEGSDEGTTEDSDGDITAGSENTPSVEPVKYTVEHYLWNWDLNDYVLQETEELTGIPGELTDAQEKTYEGCILEEEIVQTAILEDGTTVVKVRYIVLLEEPAPFIAEGLYDTSVSGDYFKIISANTYELAPGAVEHEIVLNSAAGDDRKVVHVFEVNTKEETLQVMPGYYAIDKLDPDNLPLNGIVDKSQFWKAEQLTKTVAYYEGMGYNVVGAMNTALAYDSNAPYGYMVWEGKVLGTPEVHKGAQTYLAIDWDGNCELRSMSDPLTGNEKTAISANFGWLVKNGVLSSKTVERTSSDASRSMIGIKEDGTLVFCQTDGRNAPFSSGLSNYEMGEMMLALGCVNAVNCDGGGSSTFVSKRAGETENTMRSVPSDGSERATINSVILASSATPTGIFGKALIETGYDYIAPTASMALDATGLDTNGHPMNLPAEVTYQVAEKGMGTIENGVYTAGKTTGTVTIQAVYNDKVVGTKEISIVHPDSFGFTAETTALPMDKTMELELFAKYGEDDWDVCIDGAYTLTLPEEDLGSSLNGNVMAPPSDPAMEMKTVTVTVTYNPDPTKKDTISVMFGEASKVLWDFEDGDRAGFMGFEEAKQWSIDNEVSNTLVGSNPLAGQFNEYLSSETRIVTAAEGGQVRNGQYALAWTLDNTDTNFANWSYNVLFNVGKKVVFRDTANGINATSIGMWLYIPEGAAGLAFQSQFWATAVADGSTGCKQAHFTFVTNSGVRKNLNSCTEADIPASRWVYASIDLTPYSYCSTMDPQETASNSRSPSFIRTYVKPNAPAVHTFYIDDITVDYSSAVDDRQAPVIGELQYVPQDEAKPVEGATMTTNAATFSAVVSDNTSLDAASAQIYIDGNKVATQVQGKNMFTPEAVAMDNGSHVVTFEIADKLGNKFQTSARFTVACEEAALEKGLVYVTGHNNSGEAAESGSVYYVDIMTSDIAEIDNVELNIKLNNANTWELEQAVAAEGFSFEYEVLSFDNRYTPFAMTSDIHSTDNVAVITITKTGNSSLTGEQTLVSLPVRLWFWDGYDYVNNKPIDPETNKPIVTIDYNVLFGCAETVSGEYISFGGSDSVKTKMNATNAVLHTHDEKLTVLNQAATCTVNGYENRTYCETCKSVVDWGVKKVASGHTYAIKDAILQCGCGERFNGVWSEDGKTYVNGVLLASGWLEESYYRDGVKLTGVQKVPAPDSEDEFYYDFGENGVCAGKSKLTGVFLDAEAQVYRYAQLGLLVNGWQLIGEDWYYFDTATNAAAVGSYKVGTITYEFEQTGKLTSGVWVNTLHGGRYYYGPGYHKSGWQTIDGKDYFFKSGYRLENGWHMVLENQVNRNWYFFEKDGVCLDKSKKPEDGLYPYNNGLTASLNGVAPNGMVEFDGNFYYFDHNGYAKNNGTYVGRLFLEDYAAYTGMLEKNGVVYYYLNGITAAYGLHKVDEEYYFISWGGVVKNSGTYYVNATHCDLPVGNYRFDEDGTLTNGILDVNGTKLLYHNGKTAANGLYKVEEDYYYATWGGVLMTNGRYYVDTTYCDLPIGNYSFGDDGKLFNGIVEENGVKYLYINGITATYGLYELDGEYYFSNWGGVLMADGRYYVNTTYCDLPARNNYSFDAEGKMLNGIEEVDGILYLYKNGTTTTCGLFKVDGEYYYSNWGGVLMTDGRYYVNTTYCDLPARNNYSFDAEGKMLNGVEEVDGILYLYKNGTTTTCGLFELDGEYYYSGWGGVLKTDGRYYVDTTFCDLPARNNYSFDAEGKMLNGVEEVDGTLYLYKKGTTVTAGLYELNGEYYYATWGGALMTNGRYYVDTTFCDLPANNYTFGADGKMLDGFVTTDSGIYYYVNGNAPAPGLIYVDGYYYYVNWGGKLVTSQIFYVEHTNGYTIPMNYTFDALGRLVL